MMCFYINMFCLSVICVGLSVSDIPLICLHGVRFFLGLSLWEIPLCSMFCLREMQQMFPKKVIG